MTATQVRTGMDAVQGHADRLDQVDTMLAQVRIASDALRIADGLAATATDACALWDAQVALSNALSHLNCERETATRAIRMALEQMSV